MDNDVNDWQRRRDDDEHELEDEAPVVETASKELEPKMRARMGIQQDGSGWVSVRAYCPLFPVVLQIDIP